MTEGQNTTGSGESHDFPDLVLAALHDRHLVVNQAEVDKLQLAVQWAIMHPVESIDTAATVDGTEGELAIAGPGAPLVAEFCVADLALALGMSTDAGRTYLGDALEIRYRLPKIWAVVVAGRVAVWKARRIAQATKPLCVEGAAYVDKHLADQAARCSFAQIDRSVADALRQFEPAEAEKRRREAADRRCFDVDLDQVSFDGTVHVDGELDIADAIDLNDAITAGAAHLKDLGCEESLNVRRSLAAGALARRELTLDLQVPERKRELVIYVHLADGAVAGVENTRSSISVDQVKAWCHGTNTHVTVRPVIDLNADLHTDGYRPTDTMREQAILTNASCVFPHCTRPSRSADLDHVENYDGTNTTSTNLAPLCRGHHRYKTHAGWTVVRTGVTSFTWTNRYGYAYDWDTAHTRHIR
ncbi:hypothetical protein GCM10009795_007580 [Nocardioides hankookensis]|uniref:HNH endonuclease signature motif containing protein n=1 Tax=Nocardioides hankookensis TaxID=443157 RepID=A0ABW1LGW5_9ACTN